MSVIPDTQRAWVVVRRGKPSEALVLRNDWPVPRTLTNGEVLVKVQAAALNPVGYKLMKMLPNFLTNRPHAAEYDFSGVIVDGNGTRFSNGDNVFGWFTIATQSKSRQGTLAEYLKVSVNYIALRPSNVTPVQAAGIALTSMTSYQALVSVANVEPNQTVFVNGGSSAVGAYAIQIAKARGAKVVATASGKNEEFVRRMGADEFIDYTKTNLVKYLEKNPPNPKYQVIYDGIGLSDPSLFTHSAKYLAPKGMFISTGPQPRGLGPSELWKMVRTLGAVIIPSWLGNVNRKYVWFIVKVSLADLEALQALFAELSMQPIVDSVYEFEDVQKAYDRLLTGRSTGKVVVKVDPTVD